MTNKTIPAEKARQGRTSLRIVAVLVIALALAAVVWVGLEFWGEAIDSQNIEQSGQSADQ
jgi:TRAP-type C4-dicarboxylate transport system permease small subunit